jgi:outer membrane murein-binding lipoprotein Lpp
VSPAGQNVLVAIIAVVLGAPFLNFLLSLTRAKVDRNNVIVTGAGSTVAAMGQAVEGLRKELEEVREDLHEARAELDQQAARHRQQIADMRREHRVEMADLRAQRDELAQMVKRLEARLGGAP